MAGHGRLVSNEPETSRTGFEQLHAEPARGSHPRSLRRSTHAIALADVLDLGERAAAAAEWPASSAALALLREREGAVKGVVLLLAPVAMSQTIYAYQIINL